MEFPIGVFELFWVFLDIKIIILQLHNIIIDPHVHAHAHSHTHTQTNNIYVCVDF